jgi:hypothetical protein
MIGTTILVHLMMLLPVYGEAAFDSMVWQYGWFNGKDKPFSTLVVRPILFVIGGYFAWRMGDKELWRVALVMAAAFLAWFPLLINWIRGEKPCHLGKNPWDRLMTKFQPCIFRIWFFIWLWITMLCVYYYYELYYNLF